MAGGQVKEGEEVSWKFGGSKAKGKVAKVQPKGKLTITSKNKPVSRNAEPNNPAVKVERSGNPVVKRSSELSKAGSAVSSRSVTRSQKAASKASSSKKSPAKTKKTPTKKSDGSAKKSTKRSSAKKSSSK